MNDPSTANYLKSILGQYYYFLVSACSFGTALEVIDTKKEMKKLKIDMAVAPGGCTIIHASTRFVWNKFGRFMFESFCK